MTDRERTISKFLDEFKSEKISKDRLIRALEFFYGARKNDTCRLDRIPNECSIIRNTSFKKCKTCGHFLK